MINDLKEIHDGDLINLHSFIKTIDLPITILINTTQV